MTALEGWHAFKAFVAEPLDPDDSYGEIFQAEGGCIPEVGQAPYVRLRRLVDVEDESRDYDETVSVDCYFTFDLPVDAERFPLVTVQVPAEDPGAAESFVSAVEAEAVFRDLIHATVDQEGWIGWVEA